MQKIIFIIGVGRSGTSLLQSMLANHSKICFLPETGFLRNRVFAKQNVKSVSWEDIIRHYPKILRISNLLDIDKNRIFHNEIDIYQSILAEHCKDTHMPGDKDPRLIEYIWSVNKMFPRGKFIHIIRDPRDVLLSKKKANWSKNKSDWRHIFASYVQIKLGESIGRNLLGNKYYVVTYEELISRPHEELIKLCDFLDIPFENNMIHFQMKAKELVSKEEYQWKKETLGPLLKENSGKWVNKISNTKVALIEMLCVQTFNLGGYLKSNTYNGLSAMEKLQVNILYCIFKLLGFLYYKLSIWRQKKIMYSKYRI